VVCVCVCVCDWEEEERRNMSGVTVAWREVVVSASVCDGCPCAC
jgi:hypothetical protein